MDICSRNVEEYARLGGTDIADRAGARWADIALALAGMVLLFWGLGGRSLWAAEGRWAQVTREMFQTRDFFHPTIGGMPYFDKPLLTYWLRAAIVAVTGRLDELVIRLPSAVAGLAAIWATVRIGARLWSAKTGRIAGWLLLTTYSFLFWSRTGTADAENLAAITLAVAWYWSRRDRLGFSALLVFYLIAFVGALAKGLTAVVVPILVVFPDMLVEGRWRILFTIKHIGALALALAVYLAPFAYASLTRPSGYQSSGLGLVLQENLVRYFSPFDHRGPVYLYLYALPFLLLPWTPLFVVAIVAMVKSRKQLDGQSRWLLWAILLVFLFFTLSGSRRSYYILPVLPLCALLMAVFVAWLREPGTDGLRQQGLHFQRILVIGLGAFNLAIPVILTIAGRMLHFRAPPLFHAVSLGIGVAAILSGIGLDKLVRWPGSLRDEHRVIQPWIGMAAVLLGGYFCWQQNILEVNRTERPFARQLQARISGISSPDIGIFPKCNANLLFYLNYEGAVRILKDADQVARFACQAGPGILVTQQRYAAGLPPDITTRLQVLPSLHEAVLPWESKSAKREKWVAWFWEVDSVKDSGGEVANAK